MQDGPFVDAYENGKILILDEINLASKSLLEWIEAALDNDLLSIDMPGKPLITKIPKHKDFCLIAKSKFWIIYWKKTRFRILIFITFSSYFFW